MAESKKAKMTPQRFKTMLSQNIKKHYKHDEIQALLGKTLDLLESLGFSVYDSSLETDLECVNASLEIEWAVLGTEFKERVLLFVGPKVEKIYDYWESIPAPKLAIIKAFRDLKYEVVFVNNGNTQDRELAAHIILFEDNLNNLESYIEFVSK